MTRKVEKVKDWIGAAGTVLFLVAFIAIGVAVWQFHAANIAACDKLGGHYDALSGSGECIKDQRILFDPRHPHG